MNVILEHSTERNVELHVPVPPKTDRGRWKLARLRLDEMGRVSVSKDVWTKEIQVAQALGLLSGEFKLIGRDNSVPVNQILGMDPKTKPVRVEKRTGVITAAPADLQRMLYDARRQRRVLGNTDRPKNWS